MSGQVIRSRQALHVERTARKRYRCDNQHCEPYPHGRESLFIQPGDRYVLASLPPDTDVGNTTWWHARFHVDCIEPARADREEPTDG